MKNQEQIQREHLSCFLENSEGLAKQLDELNWGELTVAIEQCIEGKLKEDAMGDYDPANYFPLVPEGAEQVALYEQAALLGRELVRSGKVAAFTVAGGQGTRLGFDGPKGTFPASPIMGKSLFQLFAERLLGFERKYETKIPWFVMCSPLNYEATVSFFKEHDYFGLSGVDFFVQGVMPATDFEGRLLVSTPDSLAFSPDGHGGSIKALNDSGAVEKMRSLGVEHLSYFQVDNPLSAIIDPLFIGLHALQESDMSSRCFLKRDPYEGLGNFVISDGKLGIVEYSDLPAEKAEERESDGRLRYRAGSPAIHLMRRDFLEQFDGGSLDLPYHRAEKKVPFVNDRCEKVMPEVANAVKFETFVFDALPFAKNPLILEADRAEEFSPIKNKTGADSVESSQADQVARARRWLGNAGVEVPADAVVEINLADFPEPEDLSGLNLDAVQGRSIYIAK